MLSEKHEAAGLFVLQRIIVQSRFMAAKAHMDELVALLDDAELLPEYIAATEDMTTEFRLSLESIRDKIGLDFVEGFERGGDGPESGKAT